MLTRLFVKNLKEPTHNLLKLLNELSKVEDIGFNKQKATEFLNILYVLLKNKNF